MLSMFYYSLFLMKNFLIAEFRILTQKRRMTRPSIKSGFNQMVDSKINFILDTANQLSDVKGHWLFLSCSLLLILNSAFTEQLYER